MSEKTKRCTACGRDLPVSQFYRDKRTADGLMGRCKSCHKASKRASDLAHRGQREAYQADYRAEHAAALAANQAARRAGGTMVPLLPLDSSAQLCYPDHRTETAASQLREQ